MYWNRTLEKVCNKRIDCILGDQDLLKVYKHFGVEFLRRSSVFHGLDRFLKKNRIQGDICFEIGTWNGLTAMVLSRYFKQVVTVDIAHNKQKHELFDYLKIHNVRCVDIESNDDKPKIIRKTDFDFCYMDGDHENDSLDDWELVRHCGRVMFQEAWPWQKPLWELVESLPKDQVVHNGDGLVYWDARKGNSG